VASIASPVEVGDVVALATGRPLVIVDVVRLATTDGFVHAMVKARELAVVAR
jgi:hypothetical protein